MGPVIRITDICDRKSGLCNRARSAAPAALCDLQIQADALAVDQHCPGINQLLSGTVVTFIAAECREREKEFYGLRVRIGSWLGSEMKRAAESETVEPGVVFEVSERRANQMRYVVVEGQSGEAVTRGCRRLGESGVDRQLQVGPAAERDEAGRGIRNKVRMGLEFLHHDVENRLDCGLHRSKRLR